MTTPPRPLVIVPRLVDEQQVAEGNLLEHPLFKLSNREARPKRAGGLLAVEDYVAEYVLERRYDAATTLVRKVVVQADMHAGFPTMFGFRILVAVIEKARSLNWASPVVPITRAEICRALGYESYGGRDFRVVDQAFAALSGLQVLFYDSWYDKAAGATHPGVRATRLISRYGFHPERRGEAKGTQLSFAYDQYVELGADLFASLKAGYYVGVDFDYLNRLPTETAQRLYDYLTKKDGNRSRSYTEDLKSVAAKLPLRKRTASGIRDALEPALKALETPLEPDGKRFLLSHVYDGSRLTVFFAGGLSLVEQAREGARRRS